MNNPPAMTKLMNKTVSMNSREIADLVGIRHDSLKRSIGRLVKQRVIVEPPMVDIPFVDASGRNRKLSVYVFEGEQGRLDAIAIAAQNSPEFTVRLAQRWDELEKRAPQLPQDYPSALRALADQAEEVLRLEQKVSDLEPAKRFLDMVYQLESSVSVKDAANFLETGQNRLYSWLRDRRLVTKRYGAQSPTQQAINRGLLERKFLGSYYHPEQQRNLIKYGTLVTKKGLIYIHDRFVEAGEI